MTPSFYYWGPFLQVAPSSANLQAQPKSFLTRYNMSSFRGPKGKVARSLSVAVSPKTQKVLDRRNFAPGQHGQNRKKSASVPRDVRGVIAGFEAADRSGKPKTDVSAMRRALKNSGTQASQSSPVSVIDGMKLYSMALKKARQTSKNTELEKKKLKYSFKKISSKIISSKTSTAAREADRPNDSGCSFRQIRSRRDRGGA